MTLGQRAILLLVLALSTSGWAAPSDPPQVVLKLDPCVPVARDEVRRWLALELGEQVITSGEGSPSSSQVQVSCEDSGRLALRIDDPLTGKAIWRSIDLSSQLSSQDVPLRARFLAVAISELLYASFAELLLDQRTENAKPQPPQPATLVKEWSGRVEDKLKQPLPPLGVELGAIGSILVQRDAPALLSGGGLRLLGDAPYHLGWDVDLQYLFARTDGALGSVRSDRIGGRLAIHGQVRVPRLYIRGGVGLRLGVIRHVGEPLESLGATASVQWGPWVTPVLLGSISVAISRLRLDLVLEGGYVAVPVLARTAGHLTSSVSGPQLLISLGVGSFIR